mgnify:CR=1 FL=1
MEYKVLKQAIPKDVLEYLQYYSEEAYYKTKHCQGAERENGSGKYFGSIEMASCLPIASEDENKKLYDIYTSSSMYNIVTKYIKKPYLFNDEIVVKRKEKEELLDFNYDNSFLPSIRKLKTVKIMLFLDSFNIETGMIEVFNGRFWLTLQPEAGDMLIIDGNCVYRIDPNTTKQPRKTYLCVYSNKPIGKNFKKGFYYDRFTN